MALPALAAIIARLTASRAGATMLGELLGSRASTALRGATARAAEVEGAEASAAVTSRFAAAPGAMQQQAPRRASLFKSAEEMLRRARPQAPQGGVDVGGVFYKAGRFLPQKAVQEAMAQTGGRIADGPGGMMFSRPGPPPIQAPPAQAGGGPGSPPSAGQDSSEAVERFTGGVSRLLLVMSPIAALGVVMAKTPSQVERFGRSLLDAQAPLRRFNGSLNAVFAELERSDLLRQRSKADATSGSTSTLAKAIDQLADDTKELRHAATSAMNVIATVVVYLAKILNWLITLNPVVQLFIKVAEKIEEWLRFLNPTGGTWHAHVNDLARGRYTGKHNKKKP